jgi:hypothetical protein
MTMNSTLAFPGAMLSASLQIANSNGTNAMTVLTGTTNGCTVGRLTMTSTDTVANTVTVSRVNGGVSAVVGTFPLPATAGTAVGVSPVDVISTIFEGVPINLAPSETMVYTLATSVTSGKVVYCHAEYGSY